MVPTYNVTDVLGRRGDGTQTEGDQVRHRVKTPSVSQGASPAHTFILD